MSKKRKKRIRVKWNNVFKFFKAIFILVFIGYIGFKFFTWYGNYRRVNSMMDEIKDATTISNLVDDSNTTVIEPHEDISKFAPYWNYINLSLIGVNLEEVRKVNPDTVGWIQIKGTEIDYPVVRGADNGYYTKHSFDNKTNNFGAIYLNSQTDLSDVPANTIILGNKTFMNTLFGKIDIINKPSWKQNDTNHIIKFATDNYTALYQVFSVYKQKGISNFNIVPDENYLTEITNKSNYDFKTTVDLNDKIITVSTNSKRTNLVIHGKMIKIRKNFIEENTNEETTETIETTEKETETIISE